MGPWKWGLRGPQGSPGATQGLFGDARAPSGLSWFQNPVKPGLLGALSGPRLLGAGGSATIRNASMQNHSEAIQKRAQGSSLGAQGSSLKGTFPEKGL